MSGTSLDGLDLAYCEFQKKKNVWTYKVLFAETLPYSKIWKNKLSLAFKKTKHEIEFLDKTYGEFIGKSVKSFILKYDLQPTLISSHGHTIFHDPRKGITLQIGNGIAIASKCKLPVVNNFRLGDVLLGGQGAPLVPVADKYLFSEYEFCLNLGGFANISLDNQLGTRIAFDICPVNIILNRLSNYLGKEFDKDGLLAKKGKINIELLNQMNELDFYKKTPPKSLGREWIENEFEPLLLKKNISVFDKLRTVTEHAAIQLSTAINLFSQNPNDKVLLTGGGGYNKFLIIRLRQLIKCKLILPNNHTIQFKEAMAFGFLGVLKIREEINILKSVTGAKFDSCGGQLFFPD